MDANEDVDNTKSHISQLFMETDLIDLHHHRNRTIPKPPTYQRRSDPIDMIIGTNLFANALTAAWILPFADPPLLKGDHHLLRADFHPGILFGSLPLHPSANQIRGINSQHEQNVIQFCKKVVTKCNKEQLAEKTTTLFSKATLNKQDTLDLEWINATLTRILVKEDQHCRQLSRLPWSPDLQQAYLLHRYWIVR